MTFQHAGDERYVYPYDLEGQIMACGHSAS